MLATGLPEAVALQEVDLQTVVLQVAVLHLIISQIEVPQKLGLQETVFPEIQEA